jgi:23S rRNA (cytosine1962-C5)-methyltransferase
MIRLTLKPGRERSLLRRHPWVFSGAIAEQSGEPAAGDTVEVVSSAGEFLARAAFSPHSQIRARAWTFDPSEKVDADLLRRRMQQALQLRERLVPPETEALRLVYAESDRLPGLIVDRYGNLLVFQFLSAGAEAWRETIIELLTSLTGIRNCFERSDADVRALEGLPPRSGLLRGTPPAEPFIISENNLRFHLDVSGGHKTGFYLDQRSNRLRLRGLARGRRVLDCFSYTGGFTVNALSGGAESVLSIDDSATALDLCCRNANLNEYPADHHSILEGDAFSLLRKLRDERRRFDLVVLDPPKFAPTAASAEKAARAYKDINLLAFKLLQPGGLLFTFSCSGGVDAALFQKIVAAAALDAGVDAQIIEHLSQAPDHPVALNFPEGTYLKGLICLRN